MRLCDKNSPTKQHRDNDTGEAQIIYLLWTQLPQGPSQEPTGHQRPISTSPEENRGTQLQTGTQTTDP